MYSHEQSQTGEIMLDYPGELYVRSYAFLSQETVINAQEKALRPGKQRLE